MSINEGGTNSSFTTWAQNLNNINREGLQSIYEKNEFALYSDDPVSVSPTPYDITLDDSTDSATSSNNQTAPLRSAESYRASLTWLINQVKNPRNLEQLSPEGLEKLRELIVELDKENSKGNLRTKLGHTLASSLPFSIGKMSAAKSSVTAIRTFEKQHCLSLAKKVQTLDEENQKKFCSLLSIVLPFLSENEKAALITNLSPPPNWLVENKAAFEAICTFSCQQGSLYTFLDNGTYSEDAQHSILNAVRKQTEITNVSAKAIITRTASPIQIPLVPGSRAKASEKTQHMVDSIIAQAVRERIITRFGYYPVPTTDAVKSFSTAIDKLFIMHLSQCRNEVCSFQMPSTKNRKTAPLDLINEIQRLANIAKDYPAWQIKPLLTNERSLRAEEPQTSSDFATAALSDKSSQDEPLLQDLARLWVTYTPSIQMDMLQPQHDILKKKCDALNLPSYDTVTVSIGIGVDVLQYQHYKLDMLLNAPPTITNLEAAEKLIHTLEKNPTVAKLKEKKAKQDRLANRTPLEKAQAERDAILGELKKITIDLSSEKQTSITHLAAIEDSAQFTNKLILFYQMLTPAEQHALVNQCPKTANLIEVALPKSSTALYEQIKNLAPQITKELMATYRDERVVHPHLWGDTEENFIQYLDTLIKFFNSKDQEDFKKECPTAWLIIQAVKMLNKK